MRFLTLAAIAALILPATTSVEVIEADAPTENAAPPAPAQEDPPANEPAEGEEGPEDAPDINENPDDENENAIEIVNPDFTQPVVKEMPKSDDKARDTLKKAYENVYSPRAKGMKKFAADLAVSVSIGGGPMGNGQPITVNVKTAWKEGDENVSATIINDDKAANPNNPMDAGVRQSLKLQLSQLMSLVEMASVGMNTFDIHFKDHSFANEKDGRIRIWFEDDSGTLGSTLASIKDGILTKLDFAGFRFSFEYEKKGRDNVAKAVTRTEWREMPDQFGELSVQEMGQTFKVAEYATEGSYTFGAKITSSMEMGPMTISSTLQLSNIAVDDKVTDAMLKAAKGEEADPAGGGEAPNEGGQAEPSDEGETGGEPAEESTSDDGMKQ